MCVCLSVFVRAAELCLTTIRPETPVCPVRDWTLSSGTSSTWWTPPTTSGGRPDSWRRRGRWRRWGWSPARDGQSNTHQCLCSCEVTEFTGSDSNSWSFHFNYLKEECETLKDPLEGRCLTLLGLWNYRKPGPLVVVQRCNRVEHLPSQTIFVCVQTLTDRVNDV